MRSFSCCRCLLVLACGITAWLPASAGHAADPLPSWQAGAAKQSILKFVEQVVEPSSPDFVPVPDRVATFDNDGTLWSEQPLYFQLAFALDRVRALAPKHPEWRGESPFQEVLSGDREMLSKLKVEDIAKLIGATHAGLSMDEFNKIAREWLTAARHPRFQRPYTELVFQPMLELLDFLRDHDFRTYIVTGGGVDFVRVFSHEVYGIPPEQVVGSRIQLEYREVKGTPQIVRLPGLDFVNDKAGKPVGIQQHIGRRPLAAFGNSDGDLQMLQWTGAGKGKRFCLLVHHTDAQREWAYDRDSHIGRLDQSLKIAAEKNWTVVDMKRDWKQIYPSQDEPRSLRQR